MNERHELKGSPPEGRPQIPPDMKEFNRALITEFRDNGGQLSGRMAGRSLLLLTTTGARSGQPRTTVLGYGRTGDRFLVIASNNGAPSHPAWYHNLLANPTATVEVGAQKLDVRAVTATPEERAELGASVRYLQGQQELTNRVIPLVILEPIGP